MSRPYSAPVPPSFVSRSEFAQEGPPKLPATSGVTFIQEPPPPCWFLVCKYLIVIVEGFAFIVCVIALFILALAALAALFLDSPKALVALIVVGLIVSLIPLYLWTVPIRGALDDKPTRLIVHAILMMFFLPIGFIDFKSLLIASIDKQAMGGDNSAMVSFYEAATSSDVVTTRLVLSAAEIVACFAMAVAIHRKSNSRGIIIA